MGEGKRGKKWKQKGHKGPLRLNGGWSIFFFLERARYYVFSTSQAM